MPARFRLRSLLILSMATLALGAAALVRVRWLPHGTMPARVQAPSLAEFSSEPPPAGLGLVFFHHDLGAQWLADPGTGPDQRIDGGGLRRLLRDNGYLVHTATRGSLLGEENRLLFWQRTFAQHLDQILRIEQQDRVLPPPQSNRVVVFKSCADNSRFAGGDDGPGHADGPALTVANAKASFRALLPSFAARPDVLFVFVTLPPFALPRPQVLGKILFAKARGQATADEQLHASGMWARQFHDWVVAADGWLAGYPHGNVAVFDLNDRLTDAGSSPFLAQPGIANRPKAEILQAAAKEFVPWLNRAVHRVDLHMARLAH
jgi:hypothetical protein